MKRIAAILLCAVLFAACSGDDDKPEIASGDSTTTTAAGGSGGNGSATTVKDKPGAAPVGSGPGTTVLPNSSSTTTAPGSGGTTKTTRPPYPVELKLDRACVRRGAAGDMQGLRVKTRPRDFVGYSTTYPGPKNEMSNPEFKTGYGYQQANSSGDVYVTWFVPETAPTGEATLQVAADGRAMPSLKFRVVEQTGTC